MTFARGSGDLSSFQSHAPTPLDRIIKSTYRTLMTRGLKGCYVYATDEGVRERLRLAAKSADD